ncbi:MULTISPECIES: cell division protein FtsZ [Halorussus]|uniref:cell division protein FtsZ n=1 Tax=Halorussus TaxID=1070314 RepID=UPI000E215A71|nr:MULTISPECIES: cell division protein FtsZ [Halorussus]NHN57463.1 cell division protein FtsZ [Halorussus sp. JP-T4]
MTKCRICFQTETEWAEDSLDEHLLGAHAGDETSVRAVYSDRYDQLFEDGEPVDVGGNGEEPVAPDDADEPDDGPGDQFGSSVDDDLLDSAYGKKWYMIGVGGAGNNIMDAILLRKDTLERNNEDRALVWRGGLAGYGMLNTNIAELEQTYYAQELKEYSRNDLLPNAIIGFGKHDYSGMGRRWDNGEKVVRADFEEGNPFRDRWDMDPQDIGDAQAIMFVHSVTKGTGCGSTPALAEQIRENVLSDDYVIDKAMLSSVVIPSAEDKFGGRARTNGAVGLARISQTADAIIPFNNERLQDVQGDVKPRIDGIERYNPPQYTELNKPLVAYLEAFTMSSTPQIVDQDATMSIQGEVFDVSDSFRPVEDKYPLDLDREYTPAVVLAPVLGRSRDAQLDESGLEILVRNALFHNKLSDFDPTTAWGGTFLVYGPEEKMEHVSPYVNDNTLRRIIGGDEFLNVDDTSGAESIDIHISQMVIPYLDDVYLWGALWNPRMPSLEAMYDHAQQLKEEGNSRQAESLRDVWHLVDPLFSCLGRENMA